MTSHDASMHTDAETGAPIRDHTFDGIQEFDNRLPNWWLWTLYLACIFSVFYWIHYHTLGTGAHPEQDFQDAFAAMREWKDEEAARNKVDDSVLIAMSQEPAAVAEGEEIFMLNCQACHTASLGGSIGPNLTDKYFLHGGTPVDIYNTIHDGAPNGMQAWGGIIGKPAVMKVSAYVMTKVGTDVEGGKEPDMTRAKVADLSWKNGN